MLPIRAWAIVYSDGSRYTDQNGNWRRAPTEGVQAVVLYHEAPYVTMMYALDEYVLPGQSAVKFGRYLPDEEWETLRLRIHEEARSWR